MSKQKEIKIKGLKVKNFCTILDLEISFDGNVTKLVGMNGSGKTTILNSIWVCFRGIAQKNVDGNLIGERFRFIGSEGRSADIELTLMDTSVNKEIIITRHILKDSTSLRFKAPKDYPISEQWLKELLNVGLLSANHFISLSPKQQALELGIDTEKFDSQVLELKEKATGIRAALREIGEPMKLEKVEPVSIIELVAKKDEIDEFNGDQSRRKLEIEKHGEKVDNLIEEKTKLESQIKVLNERIQKGREYVKGLPKPENRKDFKTIVEKIQNAGTTNKKANEYETSQLKLKRKLSVEGELKDNRDKQKEIQDKRLKYIKSFDFGLGDLSVNENGGLEYKGKLIKEHQFSKGELELIVAMFAASLNPELKVRIVDDLEHLDKPNQEKLIKNLIDRGFQVIASEVKEVKSKENEILLRECKIVPDEKEESFEKWGKQE